MKLKFICVVALLAVSHVAGVATAQPTPELAPAESARPGAFNPGSFPREVRKSLQYARDECRRQGGGRVTFAPDTVRKLDLTGDGRDDYIVDLHDTECAGARAVYCGTGGCTLDIIVARRGGGFRNVFSDRVLEYEILPGAGARTIRFRLHGSYCGGFGGQLCPKERKITGKSFVFREPK